MRSQLEAAGAKVHLYPTIEIQPLTNQSALDFFLKDAKVFDWLILTSLNAILILKHRAQELEVDLPTRLAHTQIAVVGEHSASALQHMGLKADLIPAEAVAESLVESLIQTGTEGKSCLYLRAAQARDIIKTELEAAGAQCEEIVVYQTLQPSHHDTASAAQALSNGEINLITFTSASTVTNFVQSLAAYDLKALMQGVQIASIGPVTSEAAQRLLGRVDIEAREHSISGLIEALSLRADQP